MIMAMELTTIFIEAPHARTSPPYVEEPPSLPQWPALPEAPVSAEEEDVASSQGRSPVGQAVPSPKLEDPHRGTTPLQELSPERSDDDLGWGDDVGRKVRSDDDEPVPTSPPKVRSDDDEPVPTSPAATRSYTLRPLATPSRMSQWRATTRKRKDRYSAVGLRSMPPSTLRARCRQSSPHLSRGSASGTYPECKTTAESAVPPGRLRVKENGVTGGRRSDRTTTTAERKPGADG